MTVPSLHADRETIPPGFTWFRQNEIDWSKVDAIRVHLRSGGSIPPVVVCRHGDDILPLDGHHRTAAAHAEGLPLDAWTVDGEAVGGLECEVDALGVSGRAEDYVLCGGVPAMAVAASQVGMEASPEA